MLVLNNYFCLDYRSTITGVHNVMLDQCFFSKAFNTKENMKNMFVVRQPWVMHNIAGSYDENNG